MDRPSHPDSKDSPLSTQSLLKCRRKTTPLTINHFPIFLYGLFPLQSVPYSPSGKATHSPNETGWEGRECRRLEHRPTSAAQHQAVPQTLRRPPTLCLPSLDPGRYRLSSKNSHGQHSTTAITHPDRRSHREKSYTHQTRRAEYHWPEKSREVVVIDTEFSSWPRIIISTFI